MSKIKVTISLTKEDYPELFKMKETKIIESLNEIFMNGYNIKFPKETDIKENVKYEQLLTLLKNNDTNSEVTEKLVSLENSLSKLIGLSSNSNKKGNFAENMLEEAFSQRYGDITFERKSGTAHSGDAWLYLNNSNIIMLESKNYATTINKDEVTKLESDMINHHIKWAIMISFNSRIQGFKELDLHTFVHNNETYYVIMISNFNNDYYKLDLALQIIRKLIVTLDNTKEIQLLTITNEINESLLDLNKMIEKNYNLRDSYYGMEQGIQDQLSKFHVTLRDYQYDIDKKITEIINKINNVLIEKKLLINDYNEIIEQYQDKKILPLVSRLVDTFIHKKWLLTFNEDTNSWAIKNNNDDIGSLKVQNKKAIISILNNDLSLTLHLNENKEKENKQNIEIIKNL